MSWLPTVSFRFCSPTSDGRAGQLHMRAPGNTTAQRFLGSSRLWPTTSLWPVLEPIPSRRIPALFGRSLRTGYFIAHFQLLADSPARDWHLRLIKKCAKFKILAAGGKDGTRNAGACVVQIRLKSGWISTGRIPSLDHIPIRHHAWSVNLVAAGGAGRWRLPSCPWCDWVSRRRDKLFTKFGRRPLRIQMSHFWAPAYVGTIFGLFGRSCTF